MSGGLRVGRQDILRELASTPSAQSYFIKDGEGLSHQGGEGLSRQKRKGVVRKGIVIVNGAE